MSASGSYPKKPSSRLDDILDFGPETTTPATSPASTSQLEVTARLKNLVKAIQDITRRIDELTCRER